MDAYTLQIKHMFTKQSLLKRDVILFSPPS